MCVVGNRDVIVGIRVLTIDRERRKEGEPEHTPSTPAMHNTTIQDPIMIIPTHGTIHTIGGEST